MGTHPIFESDFDCLTEMSVMPVIQSQSSAAVVTPVTIVTPAAQHVPIQTGCCEYSDRPWWGYCCFGFWFHNCAGFFMNLKLDKNMSSCSTKIWLIYIIVEVIAGILLWLFWSPGRNMMSHAVFNISFSILLLLNIPRIWSRFVQRQVFLRKQEEVGHLPNNEGCCTSLLLTWFCSPCIFGQMNSALEKQHQRFVV